MHPREALCLHYVKSQDRWSMNVPSVLPVDDLLLVRPQLRREIRRRGATGAIEATRRRDLCLLYNEKVPNFFVPLARDPAGAACFRDRSEIAPIYAPLIPRRGLELAHTAPRNIPP